MKKLELKDEFVFSLLINGPFEEILIGQAFLWSSLKSGFSSREFSKLPDDVFPELRPVKFVGGLEGEPFTHEVWGAFFGAGIGKPQFGSYCTYPKFESMALCGLAVITDKRFHGKKWGGQLFLKQ